MSNTAHSNTQRSPRVGILGHFGDRNLGDEAIIEAFSTRLRREFPGLELRMFSMHPADTAHRYGCVAYPIRREGEWQMEPAAAAAFVAAAGARAAEGVVSLPKPQHDRSAANRLARLVPAGRLRTLAGQAVRGLAGTLQEVGFLRKCHRRVRDLDVLFVAGSNQFLDNFGGAWGFPFTLLKWTTLARLQGCRVCFVSLGAGPLDGRFSKRMIRWCLRMADYASFRDEGSRALIEQACGLSGPVVPDLAFGLEVADGAEAPSAASANAPLRVAINAMPVHDPRFWHAPDPAKYRSYVSGLGEFAGRARDLGFRVSFFATHFPDANVARDALELASADASSRKAERQPTIDVPDTVQALMKVIAAADIVVATRFHGILLGLASGKPTVGICYYRKSRELLAEAGRPDLAFDIDNIDFERLACALVQLREMRDGCARSIVAMRERHREALERQFQELAHIVRERLAR